MKRKILTTILCLFFAINAYTQISGTCGTNLVWILDGVEGNKTLTISGLGAMTDYTGTAPWYPYRLDIKTIVIDNSVTTIGDRAFENCTNITNVTIGNAVTTIGNYAFKNCSQLQQITIPENITTVFNCAFQNCIQLITVNYNPINCSFFGSPLFPVFGGCSNFSLLIIGSNVLKIPDFSFQNCTGLISVTIPNNVTEIGSTIFGGCSSLVSLTIPFIGNTVNSSEYYGVLGFLFGSTYYIGGTQIKQLYLDDPYSNYYYIPTSLRNITVLNDPSIPDGAFCNCSLLTNISINENNNNFGTLTIGNSVVSIGTNAFRNCTGISLVNFNSTNCNMMGNSLNPVFSGCTNFTTLSIGNNVQKIPNNSFFGCNSITNNSLSFSDALIYIGDSAFYNNTGFIGSMTFGNGNINIGSHAFSGCSGFTGNLTFGNGNINIGSYAFNSCNGFTGSLSFGNGDINIGSYAFNSCNGFSGSLSFGNGDINIGSYAFYSCSGFLGSLIIGNGFTDIGPYAFYGCSGFENVILNSNITSIGSGAFKNCINLLTVDFNATNCTGNATSTVFPGCSNFTTLNIGNNITKIPNYLFYGCNKIENNLVIPSTVTYIGDYAFYGCTKIPSQNLSFSFINKIGNYAFYNCLKLDGYLTVKDTVGNYAFGLCIGIDSVTILPTIKYLGDNTFFSCIGLKTVNYNAINCNYMGSATLPVFSGCAGVNILNIANNVTTIPNNAFFSLSGIPSVTIPESVTFLGNNAFRNCTGLTSIIVPSNVTTIGESAFSGCASLIDIILPFVGNTPSATNTTGGSNNGKALFGFIFGSTSYTGGVSKSQYYSGTSTYSYYFPQTLRNVTITGGTQIKYGAFSNLNLLTNIIIPNTITTINTYAFAGCTGLTNFEIPENVSSVGPDAFQNCYGLTSLYFKPTNCLTMGSSTNPVFNNCIALSKINISNNVTRIASYSFMGCSNLDTITSNATIVPMVTTNSFTGLTVANISLIVPCNSSVDYQANTIWNGFTDIIEGCENYTITVSAGPNGIITPTENQSVVFGQNKTFTFTPNANFEIEDVLIDGISNLQAIESGSYTFENINSNHSISVSFKIFTYSITVLNGQNGIITPNSNQIVNYGDDITFTITPNIEYQINQVLIDGVNNFSAVSNGVYTFENVNSNHTIYVSYKLTNSVVITTISNGNGLVIGEGIYERDSSATLYAIPNANTVFVTWNDGNISNPRIVTANNNLNFIALFSPCNADSLLLLQEINSLLNEQILALQTDTMNLHNLIIQLNYAIIQLVADTIILHNQILGFQEDITSFTLQINNLQNQLNNAISSITTLDSLLDIANQTITTIQNDLTTANATITTLQTLNNDLQTQVTSLNNDLIDCNETNALLNVQILELQIENTELLDSITILNQLLEDCLNGVGVNPIEKSKLNIYPNPINMGYLHIESSLPLNSSIELYDIQGKQLVNRNIKNSYKEDIDISQYPSGTYLLRIGQNAYKVVKQ